MKFRTALALAFLLFPFCNFSAPITVNLWPEKPPGESNELPPETDTTKPTDNLIAGRRIIKLANVSTPQLTIYRPDKSKDTGVAVVICPGGAHRILALDLEGTEVAEWLNSVGVTGIVLKYRVPFRDPEKKWLAAVQDGQRAIRLARSNASEWDIDPNKIGILGFSAGGQLAGLVTCSDGQRYYAVVDEVDKVSGRPDFAVLVYPWSLVDDNDNFKLREEMKLNKNTPPIFLVHAFDDPVTPLNSLVLATEMKRNEVPVELHIFPKGGHGYGLRHVEGLPVTDWPALCESWMKSMEFLK